jgi:hypothetical protein
MTHRFRSIRYAAAALAIAATVACGGGGAGTEQVTVAGDLQRDLDLAAAAGVVTAASNGVVSAQEQLPHARQARPTATRPAASRPRQTTPDVPAAEPVETVAEAPAPSPEPDVVAPAPAPATQRPAPVIRQQPAPRGGYKTVGEIIRDAPFPIHP